MCPWSNHLRTRRARPAFGAACAAAIALASLPFPALSADADPQGEARLEAFLAELGLDSVLATQLEDRLATASSADRPDLARRLAVAYQRLLEQSPSPEQREGLEVRIAALLADVPEAQSLELRLAMARSEYLRAEEAAERWRLRLVTPAQADDARQRLSSVLPAFAEIAAAADRRVRDLERQEESAGPEDAELLSVALTSSRRTRSSAQYLAGWASCYLAELMATPEAAAAPADEALVHFGWLLNARPGEAPAIERAPVALLQYDHVARAAVGVAVAHSLAARPDDALAWLDLVAGSPATPQPVRTIAELRRLDVLTRAHQWQEALGLVALRCGAARKGDPVPDAPALVTPLPHAEARLLAILSTQPLASTPTLEPAALSARRTVADLSLGSLIALGHTADLLEIIARLPVDADAASLEQFVRAYARGAREYDAARRRLTESGAQADAPSPDPALADAFTAASRLLDRAAAAPDADRFAPAVPRARLLAAMSSFLGARDGASLLSASDSLAAAASALAGIDDDQSTAAFRLAIRAVDLAAARPGAPASLPARRQALVNRFLELHRSHASAAAMIVERATAPGADPALAAEDLLSIPDASPLAPTARHEAARLLYLVYVDAPEASRARAAQRFLSVAAPLLDQDRSSSTAPGPRAEQAAANARRVLDCALALPDPPIRDAQRAYDLLSSLVARGAVPRQGLEGELAFRAVQVALLRADFTAARAGVDRLRRLDPRLAALSERLAFTRAAAIWEPQSRSPRPDPAAARRVVELGNIAIAGLSPQELTLNDPAIWTLHVHVARAAASLWAIETDEQARDLASDLFATLLSHYANSASLLRDAADHFERAALPGKALDAWTALLKGLAPGSPEWFEAKVAVIRILADTQPLRAREVLDQHRLIYPDWGPPPAGDQLRQLDAKTPRGPTP